MPIAWETPSSTAGPAPKIKWDDEPKPPESVGETMTPDEASAAFGVGMNPYLTGGRVAQAGTELAKGATQGLLGTPIDVARSLFTFGRKPPETQLFDPATGESNKAFRQLGEIGGSMALPTVAGAIPKLVKPAEETMRLSDLLPSALKKAQDVSRKIATAMDKSDVGTAMAQPLKDRFEALVARRQAGTQVLRDRLLAQNDKAPAVVQQYTAKLNDIYTKEASKLSLKEEQQLFNSLDEMSARGGRDIDAIDKERRRLEEVANSGEMAGFSAIEKSFAGRLAKDLRSITEKAIPEYKTYLQTYSDLSKPIDAFKETLRGKKIITDAGDFTRMPKFDPAAVPDSFFKTKQTIRELTELAGGDRDFVEATARLHAASDLDRITVGKPADAAAKSADKWLRENRDWLNELPGTKTAVEDYVSTIDRVARSRKAAKWAGGAAGVIALYEAGSRPYFWALHLAGMR